MKTTILFLATWALLCSCDKDDPPPKDDPITTEPNKVDAVTAELNERVLAINGTNKSDWIEIQETASEVIVRSFSADRSAELRLWTFTKSEISEIVIRGFEGDDTFKNWYNGVYCSIDFTVHGGAGNDYIMGGSGKNVLNGGDGNSMIIGGRGTNVFYNTGIGSSIFIWRGTNDSWAPGNINGDDDAHWRFYEHDRTGSTTSLSGTTTVQFKPWTEQEIFEVLNIITLIYNHTGSYRYTHNPNRSNGVQYGDYYVTIANTAPFGARRNGVTHTIELRTTQLRSSTIVHELAHGWQGNFTGEFVKINYYASLSPLWHEFRNICWNAQSEAKPDAVAADFCSAYGMTNWGEDWCTTFEVAFGLSTPSNNYGTSDKWKQKVNIAKRFIEQLSNLPPVK